MKPYSSILTAAVALAAAANLAAVKPALRASDGWSRPAVAGTNGIGYLVIQNDGPKAETLVRVETPVSDRVEMHATSMTGGVMRMSKVEAVTVPAAGKVEFGPSGYHLMMLGLKKPLAIGDHIPATLTFASGAKVATTFSVAVMPPQM